jgi:hypothetical protein
VCGTVLLVQHFAQIAGGLEKMIVLEVGRACWPFALSCLIA